MTSDETKLFFSSAYTNYYALGEVNCTDGSLIQYIATSDITLNGKIRNQHLTSFGGSYSVSISGDLIYSPYNVAAISFDLSGGTLHAAVYPNHGNSTHLRKHFDFQTLDSTFWYDVFYNSNSEIEILIRDFTQTSIVAIWHHNIT